MRKYLVEDRALPAPYIDKLHQQGDCYADARRNAVFICRDAEGRAVGAELKGTIQRSDGSRFSGMTPDRPRTPEDSVSAASPRPR